LLARRTDALGAGVTSSYGVHPVFAATAHYAIALWFLGDVEGARTTARTALEPAQQSGNPFFSSGIGAQAALVELLFRNSVEGAALASSSATVAAEQGFAFWNAFATALSGFAQVQQGRVSGGVSQLTAALDSLRATESRFFTAYVHGFLAEGCLRLETPTSGL